MSAGLGPPPSSAGLAALVSASSSRVAAASAASPPPGSRSTRTSNGANGGASDHASSSSLGAAAAPRRDARSSPNHPVNLRRAARAELDSTYSIKSYIGAANALLEKAQSAEAGNNLEQAFVNYLKSANVATFIPKHAEWPTVLATRPPVFYRYQDFMGQVPDIIKRTTRLEAQLQAREEAREEARSHALAQSESAASDGSATPTRSEQAPGAPAIASPTKASPGLRSDDQLLSLSERLSNLRAASGEGSPRTDGGLVNARNLSMAAGSDRQDLARLSSRVPTDGDAASTLPPPPDSPARAPPPLPALDTHYPGAGAMSPSLESTHDWEYKTHIVSPSEFHSQYPPLEQLEASAPAPRSPPVAPPRPLPPPPPPPQGVPSPATQHLEGPAGERGSLALSTHAAATDGPALPRTNSVSVEELWMLMNPGYVTVSDPAAEGGSRIVKRRARSILLIDVRQGRQAWEDCHIAGDSVGLDAARLRDGMRPEEISELLAASGASPAECSNFAARHTYDLVVVYDAQSRTLAPPPPELGQQVLEAHRTLVTVFRAIYELEFSRPLRHHPVLLIGGLQSWARKVGASGLAGLRPIQASAAMSPSPSQQQEDEARRARRQGVVMGAAYDSAMPTPPPLARAPQPPQSYAPPSLPARAYQSASGMGSGAMATPPAGAPSFPPTPSSASSSRRQSDYLSSQPSIPFSGQPLHRPDGPSHGFEYPQLRATSASAALASSPALTPPPMAAASNGVASTRAAAHSHSSSLGGMAMRNGTGSLDIARRPPSSFAADPSNRSLSYSASTAAPESRAGANENARIGLTGLKNVGNSCYMNATLQCLSATVPLARFMLDGSYKRAINRTNPLGTQGALAEAFAQLIRVMWSEQFTFVSPVTFREAITRFAPAFRGYDQHDAQEFLAFLLDGLHEDLNHVVHKPPPVEMTPAREHELETLSQQIASVKEWSIYRQRNDSLIVDWFQGQFRNKMSCLTCGKTSTTYNAFMYLSLPIPAHNRGAKVTLHQCLDAFVREEVMDKADMWHCPACKKMRKASKRLTISRLPQILLVHLKRFAFARGTDKVQTLVDFPINETLDLTNYMPPHPGILPKGVPTSQSQQPPYLYRLQGVVHHFGSLNTGHYTASIRSGGDWYYADDSRVTKRSDLKELQNSSSPYILYFGRIAAR